MFDSVVLCALARLKLFPVALGHSWMPDGEESWEMLVLDEARFEGCCLVQYGRLCLPVPCATVFRFGQGKADLLLSDRPADIRSLAVPAS
jgi:hypothetical protein